MRDPYSSSTSVVLRYSNEWRRNQALSIDIHALSRPPIGELGPSSTRSIILARGDFPETATRMRRYEASAPKLAAETIGRLNLGDDRDRITHLLITCCTGLSSPGLDLEIMERCKLPSTVERTFLGFMGCYAAINAFKLARHIVRSEPEARVLVRQP